MRPLIILLVATTTLLCSFVSGVDVENSAAYDRVAECMSILTHTDPTEEKLSVETVICDAFKVRAQSNTQALEKPESVYNTYTSLMNFERFSALLLFNFFCIFL